MKKNLRKQDSMLGIKMRKALQLKIFAFAVLAFIAVICFATNPKASATVALAVGPIAMIVGGNVKKENDMSQEEKDTLATIVSKMNEALELYSKENGGVEFLQKSLDSILKDVDKGSITEKSGEFANRLKEISTWGESIKSMSQKIDALETKGLNMGGGDESAIQKAVKDILDSEKFKEFANGRIAKTSGKIKIQTKALSLGSNYTGGTTNISLQTNRVSENPQPRKIGMRDVLMSETSTEPYLTYQQITDLDRNAAVVSENGVLPESSFKVTEITEGVRRIGTTMFVSKRMLKSVTWLTSWLSNRIPAMIRIAEDFQILKGDGTGDNIKGIWKVAQNAKDVLGTLVTGAATSVLHVTSYNGGTQTMIEFKDPQSKINNGAYITFAGFTNAAYNAKFSVNKVTDRTIVIDIAYTAETDAHAAAATFTVGGEFSGTVESPTIADAIMAVQAYLTYGEYTPNSVSIHPIDVFKIRMLKDTQDRYLDIIKQINGVWFIGNLPITETTAVLPGEFVIGDFMMAASIVDFTSLELEFAEDVTTKRANQVAIIAQEEVIFPIYNPFAFLVGKFSEVITLITKA